MTVLASIIPGGACDSRPGLAVLREGSTLPRSRLMPQRGQRHRRGRRRRAPSPSVCLFAVQHVAARAADRRRRAGAVRRRWFARPAPRPAAGRAVGAPGRAPRWCAGPSRPRELASVTRPHGLDSRRAHDRARARHVRRHARRGPESARPRCAVSRSSADYVVTPRSASTRSRRGPAAARARPGVDARVERPRRHRHRCRVDTDVKGVDPATIGRVFHFPLDLGLARRAWRPTARS